MDRRRNLERRNPRSRLLPLDSPSPDSSSNRYIGPNSPESRTQIVHFWRQKGANLLSKYDRCSEKGSSFRPVRDWVRPSMVNFRVSFQANQNIPLPSQFLVLTTTYWSSSTISYHSGDFSDILLLEFLKSKDWSAIWGIYVKPIFKSQEYAIEDRYSSIQGLSDFLIAFCLMLAGEGNDELEEHGEWCGYSLLGSEALSREHHVFKHIIHGKGYINLSIHLHHMTGVLTSSPFPRKAQISKRNNA